MNKIRHIYRFFKLSAAVLLCFNGLTQNPVVLLVRETKTSGDTVWTDVITDHFKNIVSFQFTLAELQDQARYVGIENLEPSLDLSPANYSGQNPETRFRINWTYPNVNGLSLSPGMRMFTIKWIKTTSSNICIGVSPKGPTNLAFQYSQMLPNTTLTFNSCEKIILTHFNVFYDRNNDCTYNAGETLLDDYEVVDLFNNQNTYYRNLYAIKQEASVFGKHEYTVQLPNALWQFCQNSLTSDLNSNTQIFALDFPMQAVKSCAEMEIELSTNEVKRCEDYTYQLKYRNKGTQKAGPVNIRIELDAFTRFVKASILPTNVVPPFVFFQIPEVEVLTKGEFEITVHTDCNSTIIGQTHCVKATIFPNASCENPSNWDGSSLRVTGKCENGINKFQIINGINAMTSPSQYWIVEEDLMPGLKKDIRLGPNQVFDFEIPGDGKTYRLSADQTDNHPGRSYPSVAIEGCGRNGQGTYSLGYVSQFSDDEEDDFVATDCRQSVEANMSNRLSALPTGALLPHFIEPGRMIEYTIRFQNEGNDTAYRIVIRDTLSPVFDLSSLVLTNSSHPFTYGVENRVLTIRFDPIRLPFKQASEMLSRGFVTFSLRLRDDITATTRFENRAEIIFEKGPFVLTAATFHTIKREFLVNDIYEPETMDVRVYPNPNGGNYAVTCLECSGKEQLYLFDMEGKLWHTQPLRNKEEKINLERVSKPGLYYQIIKRGETLCYYGSITILP